ncbi:MAG: hypothetical protein MJZ38_03095 [archaeon]|nr:hypothetical protein [archaeon]
MILSIILGGSLWVPALCGAVQTILVVCLFIESERALPSAVILAIVSGLALLVCDGLGKHLVEASTMFMYVVLLALYQTGVVRGGADVKCLIGLGFMYPCYPELFVDLDGVPMVMEIVMVPAVSVLFLASILSVLSCMAYCVWRNRGEKMPATERTHMITMSLDEAEHAFVWPVRVIRDGSSVKCLLPDDDDMARLFQDYRMAGVEKVVVTPMIPFIIPILAATLVLVFTGNPLFIL